jgi:hypothetical protein
MRARVCTGKSSSPSFWSARPTKQSEFVRSSGTEATKSRVVVAVLAGGSRMLGTSASYMHI